MRGAATEEATAVAEPAGPLAESTERCGQAACDDSHFSMERNFRFDRSEMLHLNVGEGFYVLNSDSSIHHEWCWV